MSQRVKKVVKASLFMIIALVILAACNFISQPIWKTNTYDTFNGFYSEPRNTIETIFLGSSHVKYAISPMQLYEDYGICAYDLSTDSQPVLASYYLLEEAYRLHSETLETVVLDMSMIKRDPNISFYHVALDSLEIALPKLRSIKAYSDNFEDFMQNTVPLLSYHERWKELTDSDFLKYGYEAEVCIRGYNYNTSQWVSGVNDFSTISMPLVINDQKEDDEIIDDTALSYFEKIVDFCDENSIQLVLIKTPTDWTSANHNAVQNLADLCGLDFIDFNVEPFYSETGFNFAEDLVVPSDLTNLHVNYYGAQKLTDYLGQYLIEQCGNKDVRGNDNYAFMEEELSDYNQYVSFRQSILNAADPCDYIEAALDNGNCTIFISVKDDAASALTEEQRAYFESIGLIELSQLTYGCSYLAVVDDGNVLTEQYQKDPGEANENDDLITFSGTLHNGTAYTVVSGGYHMGNKSSIIIEDTERSSNKRGLNIVIYDNQLQRFVESARFDTHVASEREAPFNEQNYEKLIEDGTPISSLTGTDRIMYLYNRVCENDEIAKLARLEKDEEDGLITYLKAFWDDEKIDIFITTQGDASEVLTDTVRTNLLEMGLVDLSQLSDQDSYAAAICGGTIELEENENSSMPLEVSTDQYTIRSTSREESDDTSSVIINGTEYSSEEDGIFIVIYDNITEMAVDTITFELDTNDSENAEEAVG